MPILIPTSPSDHDHPYPYGQGRVRHQPALELMQFQKTGSVGLYCFDPPFHIGITRDQGGIGKDPWTTDVSTIDDMIAWSEPVAKEMHRTLRPGGSCVCMGGAHSIAAWEVAACRAGLQWMADITVLWNTGKPRNRSFGSLTTTIRWHIRPGSRHAFNAGSVKALYSNVIVATKVPLADRVHVAQKPCELTNFIVSLLSHPADLVVDPFCGSGSTVVSASMCGRSWLAGDSDLNSCYLAEKRTNRIEMEQAELRPLYFWINGKLEEIAA